MITAFVILGIIIYIIGIAAYLDCETTHNVKFHEGGLFNMGYFTNDNKRATVRNVRLSLIWPILLIIGFIKNAIWCLNDIAYFPFLLFKYDYRNTKFYKWVKRVFD